MVTTTRRDHRPFQRFYRRSGEQQTLHLLYDRAIRPGGMLPADSGLCDPGFPGWPHAHDRRGRMVPKLDRTCEPCLRGRFWARSAMMDRRLSQHRSRLIAADCAWRPAVSPPPPRLRSAMVVPKQPAQTLTAPDLPVGLPDRLSWLNQLVVQALVIPFFVVMGDELFHGAPQLALAKEDHLAQALGLDGSHEALRVRSQIRTPRGQLDRRHTRRLENRGELLRKQRAAIVDQVPLGS